MKRLRKPLMIAALALAAVTVWGCSSGPNYFGEAPVPQGWPELTPIDEIRVNTYPAYRAAAVVAGEDASDSSLFRPLFNHIKREDIAMTAPVEMTYDDQGEPSSMAFLYRNTQMGATGQDEADPRIEIADVPEQYAASIGVRGRYSAEHFDQAVQELNAWLADNQDAWRAAGEPRYLGYNSPFVPWFLRYGEVQIPVQPVTPTE